MYPSVIVILLTAAQVNGQFGEIASLVSGVLTPALVGSAAGGVANSAAGAASSLLNSIGTLYQIAQGALQLTGTGVGILNQASEGRWFNTVLEGAMNNNREIQERILTSGSGPDYAQLGTNFPAPSPGDYDHEEFIRPEGLISISSSAITDKSTTTDTPMITLFPEENETDPDPKDKENQGSWARNLIIDSTENGKGMDRFEEEEKPKLGGTQIFGNYDAETEQAEKETEVVKGKMTKLQRLIALLRESNFTESDLREMTLTLEKMKKLVESRSLSTTTSSTVITPTTTSSFLTTTKSNSASVSVLPVRFRRVKFNEAADNEDSDLLPATTLRPRVKAIRIKWRPKNEQGITTPRPIRKYPRRTAYTARLPLSTTTTSFRLETMQPAAESNLWANSKTPEAPQIRTEWTTLNGETRDHHSEVVQPKKEISSALSYGTRIMQQHPSIPENQFPNSAIQGSAIQPNAPATFSLFPASPLRPQPQASNVFQPQTSYMPSLRNNYYYSSSPFHYPSYSTQTYFPVQQQYRKLTTYTNSNANLAPSSRNLNPAPLRPPYNPFGWPR